MSNNITLNIVEPGSPTPDPVVPNTGLFTSGIGGPEATAIGAILILTIAAIAVAFLYRKQKKVGKVTKLVHIIDSTKAVLKSKKRVTVGLTALALLASAGTLTTLLASAGKSNTNAIDGEAMAEAETITPTVSGNELTVELGSEPVFAILPVDITVEQATEAGYTLTAYTDNTDLISTTDSSKVIPMVAVEGDELTSLTDNTYGLSLVQPETKDDEAYTSLSTDQDNPTFITDKDYEPTEANDTTTIYYGFYITPDIPYGTYTGSDINYNAVNNDVPATVVYDGNGLYFNGDETQTTNTAKYVVETSENANKYSHTPNVDNDGENDGPVKWNTQVNEVVTIPGASKLHIEYIYGGGYTTDYGGRLEAFASFWEGAWPSYTPDTKYEEGVQDCGKGAVDDGRYYANDGTNVTVECDISGDTVTFGYWSNDGGPGANAASYGYYAAVTGYDAGGNIIRLPVNNPISGTYLTPASDSYYRFLGWSKSSESTVPEYATEDDIKNELALTPGETTTLYAIWEPAFTISYNANGADSTTNMDNVEQYTTDLTSTEQQVDLLASNFKKDGYGFAGWSTDANAWENLTDDNESNDPVIYGPNQMITVDPTASTKLTLYAIWADLATDKNGEELTFQTENLLTTQLSDNENDTLANKDNGYVTALKDERNDEVYAVAKLADGNYWMIENLRLDDSATLTKTEGATKGNTNNPNLPLTNNYAEQITSNKLSASSDEWCNSWDTTEEQIACYDHSNLNTYNVAKTTANPSFSQDFTSSSHNSDFDANIYSYGNYYNWYSATAGNGTYSTGEQSAETVAGDLCPAGWKLPIGKNTSDNGSFYQLNQALNNGSTDATVSNRWRSFPNNFVYSGNWSGSSAYGRGINGYYWSSTAYTSYDAYYLFFNSGDVRPGTDYYRKYNGYSVRCVAPTE